MDDAILPHLNRARILRAYESAPGNEIESGKFASPESSAALAANAFGLFLDRPADLPPLPACEAFGWPATAIDLEAIARFPWSGGKHPCLDAMIVTSTALIGVESKRYEPHRPKQAPDLSEAYWRDVWGENMRGYCAIRDRLRDGTLGFAHLDAAQLVKHAFGLRTQAHKAARTPVLFYIYAEPAAWPDGRRVRASDLPQHRAEIALFADAVASDDVQFRSAPYAEVLTQWRKHAQLVSHAEAVGAHFNIGAS